MAGSEAVRLRKAILNRQAPADTPDVFQKLYRGRIGDYLEVEAAGVTNEPTGKL